MHCVFHTDPFAQTVQLTETPRPHRLMERRVPYAGRGRGLAPSGQYAIYPGLQGTRPSLPRLAAITSAWFSRILRVLRRKTDGDGPCYLQADEEAVDRTLRGDRGAGVLAILGRKAELRVAVRLAKALSVLKEDVLFEN